MAVDTALAVVPEQSSALVLPAVDAPAMRQAMIAYTELCRAVLDPSDYQQIQGKTFKKRSAWQKLATAFSVTTEIVNHVVHTDEDGRVVRAEFVVRATAPNGRHEDGYGAASKFERTFSKPEHDIPATAETRARNRACANLFAFGELTAEEAEEMSDEEGERRQGASRQSAPQPQVAPPPSPPKPLTRGKTVTISKPAAGATTAPLEPAPDPFGESGEVADEDETMAQLREKVLTYASQFLALKRMVHTREAAYDSVALKWGRPLTEWTADECIERLNWLENGIRAKGAQPE